MTRFLLAMMFAVIMTPFGSETASANGCHRNAQNGPAGLHYHVGPGCERVAGNRGYRGNNYNGNRGARCVQRCKYIGPIKSCRRECR
jgi:hypothetical protein